MSLTGEPSGRYWTRHFAYRSSRLRTTWKLRIGALALLGLAVWLSSGWWTVAVANSLVCDNDPAPSDAILIENFDAEYLLFERAAQLRRSGVASRVLVPLPVAADDGTFEANAVAQGIAETMARISRVGSIELLPVREIEPISINAARDMLPVLTRGAIRSVIVVTPLFRSRRSMLVYGATLGRAGIDVRCAPVAGTRDVRTWTRTWHGIQNVVEQFAKLQYYRFYVLPFRT